MHSSNEQLNRYPSSISIPLQQIDEWLNRAQRVSKLHSKRGDLSLCQSRLARAKARAGDLVVPELSLMGERILQLELQVREMEAAEGHLEAEKHRLERLSLNAQCAALSIPVHTIPLEKSREGWRADGRIYRKPERAVYALLANEGYSGGWIEGQSIQLLMHAAVLDYALAHYPDNKRYGDDMLLRTQFHAVADQMHEHAEELVRTIELATRPVVAHRLEQLLAMANSVIDLDTSAAALMALWDGLGSAGIAKLAHPLVRDPWYFRVGWPNLTVVRDGNLRFIEVKTTDTLMASQLDTIRELLLPAGSDVSVVRLVPASAEATLGAT